MSGIRPRLNAAGEQIVQFHTAIQLTEVERHVKRYSRWVIFQTNKGPRVGREVSGPEYTSRKWIRVAMRTPEGTRVIKRDVRRDRVLRVAGHDRLEARVELARARQFLRELRAYLAEDKMFQADTNSGVDSPRDTAATGDGNME